CRAGRRARVRRGWARGGGGGVAGRADAGAERAGGGDRARRGLRYLRGGAGAARRRAGEGGRMNAALFPAVEANAARLQAWLQQRLEGFGGDMQVERLPGGRSNPGWRLRTAQRDCVLRARPGPRARLLPSTPRVAPEFPAP